MGETPIYLHVPNFPGGFHMQSAGEPLIYTEYLAQGLGDTWCLIKWWPSPLSSSSSLVLHSSALLAYLPSHIKWGEKSSWSRWLRHWQIHWKLQWVIRCWSWWYFPVIDSVRGSHFPGPGGLVMQSTLRLLVYKTTTQKLFTKINDARPAIKKVISQVTRSAKLHQLL